MSDIAIDPVTGDLDLTGGDLNIVDGVDAIAQHVRIRLRTFLGEWFLDQRIGVPYYQQILVKNPATNTVRRILQEVVATTPGIVSVDDFSTDYDGPTRVLSVRFTATADGGAQLQFTDELIVSI